MYEQDLKELLQGRGSKTARRGWRCPDETQLAAYFDSKLQGSTRESVEKHVADCDFCLSQISFLFQSADWTEAVEVPAPVLRRARDLVPRKSEARKASGWRWAAASATLASLVIIITFIALRFRTQQPANLPSEPLIAQQHQPNLVQAPQASPVNPRPAPTHATEKLRSPEPVAPEIRREGPAQLPALVFPRNGATLRRNELDFRWQPFADTVFYDIRVVTAEGDLVLESKTEDTHLRIADSIPLQPGAKYFVSVRAHLRQGRTVKSGIVSFRISD
jgi:hypothetical protein